MPASLIIIPDSYPSGSSTAAGRLSANLAAEDRILLGAPARGWYRIRYPRFLSAGSMSFCPCLWPASVL
jgi:hypothetical protein